jgi:hypothetical protein
LSLSYQIYGFGTRDPRTGIRKKKLFRIPDPGSKRHWIPDPEPGSATLVTGDTTAQLVEENRKKNDKFTIEFLDSRQAILNRPSQNEPSVILLSTVNAGNFVTFFAQINFFLKNALR